MKIVYTINQLRRRYKNPVVAIGVFDGLHRGHQKLIKKSVQRAKEIHGTAFVITFDPHPVQMLRPEVHLPTLISLSHRLKLIKEMGVDVCLVIHFTKKFSQLNPDQFISRYLCHAINPKEIFVGYDFRFGKDRTGSLALFQEKGCAYGFKVNIIQAVRSNKKAISSTLIRSLISDGQLNLASHLLGRYVSIMGKVIKGDARGKTLGYPTANINPQGEIFPPSGVYAVRILIGKSKYFGMSNIGQRPSFKNSNRLIIEVHIFNFHRNIYNKEIIIDFIKKIREEKMFNSRDMLIRQLAKDEKKARAILKSIH